MPMYDFLCETCHKSFEELASPDEIPACPECGAAHVIRKISAPSPLKTGAFPYKVGPVRPMAQNRSAGCPKASMCGAGGGFA